MAKGRPGRVQKRDVTEKKRDERAVKRALQRERKLKGYLDENDEDFIAFSNQLEVQGFRVKDIPGDGNCLFRALADQLDGDMTQHMHHRRETVRYMEEHKADFAPFVEDDVPFDKHIRNLAKLGTFGGNDSIVAFARNNGVDVVIHQHNAPRLHVSGSPVGTAEAHHLNISYHYGEHYSSLRRHGDSGVGPGYILVGTAKGQGAAAVAKPDRKAKKKSVAESSHAPSLGNDSDVVGDMLQQLTLITGCEDSELLTQALADCAYNVDTAAEYVFQLIAAQEDSLGMAVAMGTMSAASGDAQDGAHAAGSMSAASGDAHDGAHAAALMEATLALQDLAIAASMADTRSHRSEGKATDQLLASPEPSQDKSLPTCSGLLQNTASPVSSHTLSPNGIKDSIAFHSVCSRPVSEGVSATSSTADFAAKAKAKSEPKASVLPHQRKADKKRERKVRRAEERRLELQEKKEQSKAASSKSSSGSAARQPVVDVHNVVEGVPQLLSI